MPVTWTISHQTRTVDAVARERAEIASAPVETMDLPRLMAHIVRFLRGGLTGDTELQTEGKIDKAKGEAHNIAGNVKDAAKDLTK